MAGSRHSLFRAIKDEAKAVYSAWSADWLGCGITKQELSVVINAAIYTICFSFLTNAALGYSLFEDTNGEMGVVEAFMSSAITGIFMVCLGGQPSVLYGQTGPVVLLYSYVYSISHTLEVPFKPWVAWIGLFAFVMHAILAAFGTCDFKRLVTPFTEEIFAVLVAADFLTTAVLGFRAGFGHEAYECTVKSECQINGLFTLLLGIWFYSLALKIGGLQRKVRWSSARLLRFLSEYFVPLTLLIVTVASFIPHWSHLDGWPAAGVPARIKAPSHWGLPEGNFSAVSQMGEVPGWAIAAALVPAFLLTVLFYVDQNLSAMMACNGGGLCKVSTPEAYNLELFLLGITVLVTGFLGLPASSGLIPQNPMHTRALTVSHIDVGPEIVEDGEIGTLQDTDHSRRTTGSSELAIVGPEAPAQPTTTRKMVVVEQRFSGILHSVFLGIVVFIIPILGWIPLGVLWGGFLLLASEAYNLSFIQRILLCLTSSGMRQEKRERYPDLIHILDTVPYWSMLSFTLVQVVLWVLLYLIAVLLRDIFPVAAGNTWVMVGASFPVLVCIYAIPVRTHLLPLCFSPATLQALDPSEGGGSEE